MNFSTNDSENKFITGFLNYNDCEYSFIFDGYNLELISISQEKRNSTWTIGMNEIRPGVYTMGDLPLVEQEILIGRCNENGKKIAFFPINGSHITHKNSVLYIIVESYIIYNYDEEKIDRIKFSGPEINCIHPSNQAIQFEINSNSFINDGVFGASTRDFSITTSKKQEFSVDGQVVSMCFGVSRMISTKIEEPPITLWSNLMFEFEPTNDYCFIKKLYYAAKQFIQFLCYRRDVCLTKIELDTPTKEGKHKTFATLNIINNQEKFDIKSLKAGRYIKQIYIEGSEGKIMSNIINNKIYLRDLPISFVSGTHIDAARFVMITAAFEWEFKQLYPAGIPKSEERTIEEQKAKREVKRLIKSSSGKEKKIYKEVLNHIGNNYRLEDKINKVCSDYSSIIDIFGKHLYNINNVDLIYTDMAKRIGMQRNRYAHGDLDKEFIDKSLLDLIFLERIIYAMQLKACGVDDINIQKAINELFQCRIEM